ncbi:hypothetical protein HerbRD11066_74540 [Herbidospora sp. RD11066]
MAAVAVEEAEHDPQGGGLPGAVGAEEAVDLSGTHLEIEPVEGADVAEAFGQAVNENGGVFRHGRLLKSIGQKLPTRLPGAPIETIRPRIG